MSTHTKWVVNVNVNEEVPEVVCFVDSASDKVRAKFVNASEVEQLKALVRDMYRCIAHANEQDWFHFEKDVSGCGLSCTVNGENCGLASLANRMKKLGIEVDYE